MQAVRYSSTAYKGRMLQITIWLSAEMFLNHGCTVTHCKEVLKGVEACYATCEAKRWNVRLLIPSWSGTTWSQDELTQFRRKSTLMNLPILKALTMNCFWLVSQLFPTAQRKNDLVEPRCKWSSRLPAVAHRK